MSTDTQTRISNRCPACGSQSLFIGSGGWLTCGVIGCPNPSPDDAMQQARVDIIRAHQLQRELEEARREALAMRAERDIEISKRVVIQTAAADILRRHAADVVDLAAPELNRSCK